MKIIVGLGNPGESYRNTRHNAGRRVIAGLRRKSSAGVIRKHRLFRAWEADFDGTIAVLVRPRTFMNGSGKAVNAALQAFGESPGNLVVVHDDLDIPLGSIKVTPRSGPGSHNGVISVIEEAGTRYFPRVRVGIGREHITVSPIQYVLSPVAPDEKEPFEHAVECAVVACEDIVILGIEKAMTKHNTAEKPE